MTNEWYLSDEDVDSVTKFIKGGDYKKVGLQFPNDLLSKAVSIAKRIEATADNCGIAILADTSFGSCCVDEVAGQHYSVDAIVHFGSACLSSSSGHLPVKYVFGHRTLDVNALRQALTSLSSERRILLLYDFEYLSCVRAAATDNCVLTLPALPEYSSSMSGDAETKCGRFLPDIDLSEKAEEVLSSASLVYVGASDLCFSNILFSFNHCHSYHLYDVESSELIPWDRLKQMRRRLLLIEKARAAQSIGLLVGTLGSGGRYMAMLDHLRRIIRDQNKRCYTLMIGKLNPTKLQNFSNLDCFVLVACPQNSLFDIRTAEDYSIFQPIVSPYEMEQACLPEEQRSWSLDFVTDFEELLRLAKEEAKEEATGDSNQSSSVVLAANRLVASRDQVGAVSHLPQRAVEEGHSWFGLEAKVGQTPVLPPTKGRTGIAIAYEEEEQ